ncbi:hydroxyacylglutathione hydrolase [Magnetospira sp. QH-2]|uniref:hydroxyacylglutathione hydrolase n=1 Tax=Magnetospira sp. (strain QH-2) TaxID=1288970 RepID=UPI0003E8152E|nr:hydroxyacylglutathione hydrolase [Magnetospira sp. QH-2]CCQ74752.1 hydroxyacylglutathione hydrolase [Magnetospira sp. QH-2]
MPGMEIIQIPALTDNYIYLLHDNDSGKTAVVDPAMAQPVLSVLNERDWTLDYILCTHHHRDHVGGNEDLKMVTRCQIVGAASDTDRIPGLDLGLKEGDLFALGNLTAQVLDVPGHTMGHIAFWFAEAEALFCGDTLFSLGCGRLFEGTPQQMWASLEKLRALPDSTQVYCAHEYTNDNADFALSVDPANQDLQLCAAEVKRQRENGQSTVPSSMAIEKRCNPFLRPDQPDLQMALGMTGLDPASVFAEVRRRKDAF